MCVLGRQRVSVCSLHSQHPRSDTCMCVHVHLAIYLDANKRNIPHAFRSLKHIFAVPMKFSCKIGSYVLMPLNNSALFGWTFFCSFYVLMSGSTVCNPSSHGRGVTSRCMSIHDV
jgi:hypothetical protein